MSNRRQSLIGKRYGRGIVSRMLGKDKWNCFVWELVCDCGKIYKATTGNLNAGHVTSCGCYLIEQVTKNVIKAAASRALPNGHGARNELLLSYRTRAKKNGIPFELTIEQFTTITQQPCAYCNTKPAGIYKGKRGDFIYNGIDRVDPRRGYELDNVVPCCKRCNQGKNDMTKSEFYEWITKIYHFRYPTMVEEARHVA